MSIFNSDKQYNLKLSRSGKNSIATLPAALLNSIDNPINQSLNNNLKINNTTVNFNHTNNSNSIKTKNKTSVNKIISLKNIVIKPHTSLKNSNLDQIKKFLNLFKKSNTRAEPVYATQIIVQSKNIDASTEVNKNNNTLILNNQPLHCLLPQASIDNNIVINNITNATAYGRENTIAMLSTTRYGTAVPYAGEDLVIENKTNKFTLDINSLKMNKINNRLVDFSIIESLTENDNLTKKLKEMAINLTEKNKIIIKQQKMNEIMKLKLNKQLKLRKHLKLLSNFKSYLALNKNFVYKFNHNHYAQKCLKNTYNLLKNLFLTFNCIISKPIFKLTPDKLVILLFFFNSNRTNNRKIQKAMKQNLFNLCLNLSKILNISVELDLVKLKNLNLEGQILANSIGIITDKLNRKIRFTAKKIFKKTNIINPDKINNFNNLIHENKTISNMTGINIRLAGRLMRQSIVPRKTVEINQRGSFTRRHSDFVTIAKYTTKNRRGIFCYTVTMSHKCY